jgi:ABC-type sugar transport system ATPase subunit
MNVGRIEQIGTPLDLYRKPANRFVASFIGSPRMNMLPGSVDGQRRIRLADGSLLPLQVQASEGAAVSVGVRAEHLALALGPGQRGVPVRGEVRLVEHLGSDVYVHVAVAGADGLVVARRGGDASLSVGTSITLGLDADYLHVFDANGARLAAVATTGAV